jgi:phospholipid-binding lipoprotein MlaA
MNPSRFFLRLSTCALLIAPALLPANAHAQMLAPAGVSGGAPLASAEPEEEDEYATQRVSDPFAPFNRTVFRFNDSLYRHVARPVARGYQTVVPGLARRGIGSFFENIAFPVRFTGSLLQGKVDRSGREVGKFLLNSTFGLAGFIKISDQVPELKDVPKEDLGQALGSWGIGHGPFLVLPLLGPTSLRDAVGRVGDGFLDPVSWQFVDNADWRVETGLRTLGIIDGLPGVLDTYDALRKSALDPYVAFRNGYLQYRDAELKR